MTTHDPVNNPKHYTQHPSGIEAIQITEHMSFCLGNAVKYVWRADLKNDAIEDLRKAVWYIEREIDRRKRLTAAQYQQSEYQSSSAADPQLGPGRQLFGTMGVLGGRPV